jgi:hypothetical protein
MHPEGCEKVAGGRSEAKTTGETGTNHRTLTECQIEKGQREILLEFSHHFVVQVSLICSGGFRFASTTGYYLPALRADDHQQLSDRCRNACTSYL